MADWTGAAQGAIAGASTGATIGSAIPGVGTLIGAAAGGVTGGVAGLFGNKKKKKKLSTFDKRQKQLNENQHQAVLGQGPLADLYNYNPDEANAVFDQNQARVAYRDLNEKGIPSITGQFRNANLMNSSYAADAVGRLTRDVQEKLIGERSKYLYDEQNNARTAKRNAVEGLQNRQTFAYDTAAGTNKSFDLNAILKSITPDMAKQLTDYFKKNPPPAKTDATQQVT